MVSLHNLLLEIPIFREAARFLFSRRIYKLHTLPRNEREQRVAKDKALFLSHLSHIPYWRAKLEKSETGWLSRSDLHTKFSELISPKYPAFPLYSSGSTGEPVKFLVDKKTFSRRAMMPYYALRLYSEKTNHRIIRLSFSDMPWAHQQGMFLDPSQFLRDRTMEVLNNKKPNVVYGTVSHMLLFADHLRSENIRYPFDIILTRSEALTDKERRYLEHTLGGKAYNIYASREFGPLAQECTAQNGLHVNEEAFEIQTNAHGEALITYFFNYSLPFYRYEIGDLIEEISGPCTCELTTKRIKVIGRTSDFIEVHGGKIPVIDLLPSFGMPGIIKTFQIIEKQKGLFIKISSYRELQANEVTAITKNLHQILKTNPEEFPIEIENSDTIPLLPNGKRRLFIPQPTGLSN